MKPTLLLKFSIIALILIIAIAAVLTWNIQQQMEENELRVAAETTAAQVSMILNKNLGHDDIQGQLEPARFAEIDSLIRQYLIHEHIVRVKIWNRNGILIYSDEKDLVGQSFPVNDELSDALNGKISMDISSLKKEENVGERNYTRLMEIYIPLEPANSTQILGAYEIYQDLSFLDDRIAKMRENILLSVFLSFLILYGSLFMLVRNASRELIRKNEENAHLYQETKQRLIEKIKAEDALKESQERYRTIIENSNDMIWTLDIEGHFIFLNKRSEEICGLRQDEWHSKDFFSLIIEEDLDLVRQAFQNASGGRPQQIEFSIKCPECGILLLSVNTAPLYSKDEITGTVSFGRDITERKKAEEIRIENERLAFLSKTKSEFLASMSHELRTPLNSIIGFSELLTQKTSSELNDKQERYINNIITSGKFLLNLINDILDLSKVEAGKIELVKEKISVPEMLDSVIILMKEKASQVNVHLKKEIDPQLEFIEADSLRFKQILFNLLSNAVKFSRKDGIVVIEAKKLDNMAQFSVSDNGIGIKEEDMGKLFKEFGQASPKISKEYGGTGLGLAITKKLVGLHGGSISVKSKYGEGTTFIFTIPLSNNKDNKDPQQRVV